MSKSIFILHQVHMWKSIWSKIQVWISCCISADFQPFKIWMSFLKTYCQGSFKINFRQKNPVKPPVFWFSKFSIWSGRTKRVEQPWLVEFWVNRNSKLKKILPFYSFILLVLLRCHYGLNYFQMLNFFSNIIPGVSTC